MNNELETPRVVELVEVIHTQAARGIGSDENPVRVVDQHWDKTGKLLAENDEYYNEIIEVEKLK